MDLDLNDDQLALRDAVGGFLAKESPVGVVREAEPSGFDAALWAKVAEMGLPSITVPEALGGGGCGFIDLAIAVEELGRSLAPVPLIEASVANHLLASLAGQDTEGVAAGLAPTLTGKGLTTLALRPVHDGVAGCVPAGAVADTVVALDGDELVASPGPSR